MTPCELRFLELRAESMRHTARAHPQYARPVREWLIRAAASARKNGMPALAEKIARLERSIL